MTTAEHIFAVILAGGSGTRFWPKSRLTSPKQLCKIGDSEATMLELTLQRLDDFIPPERRLIVTHRDQMEATRSIVGDRCQRILAEPEARNTASALALAAIDIESFYQGNQPPIMISLHADHIIAKLDEFKSSLQRGIAAAEQGSICLLGILPAYPETGYGYIERGEGIDGLEGGYKVKSFREKPDLETAKSYLEKGGFYWNAGIFVWQNQVLLDELHHQLPVIVDSLRGLVRDSQNPKDGILGVSAKNLQTTYSHLPKISIDHAVLEISENVVTVEADIGWKDVGSWDALSECFPTDENGNLSYGESLALDCRNTTIDSDGAFVATIGLDEMVVVSAKGGVLVCPKSRAQDVKHIVEALKKQGRLDLL